MRLAVSTAAPALRIRLARLFCLFCMSLACALAGTAHADAPGKPPSGAAVQVVEYYGDSTVWGYASGSGRRVAKPAPAAFAEALATAPVRYEVINQGVNGSTACQLLEGKDGVHPSWDAQMAASKARYVILNFGINDEWKYDVGTYESCLLALARQARRSGKQVVFETPNPTRDSGGNGLDVYVNAMKAVALREQVPIVDQYAYLTAYLDGRSVYAICPDGLHPTDAVYAMKGRYAAGVFAKLFVPR